MLTSLPTSSKWVDELKNGSEEAWKRYNKMYQSEIVNWLRRRGLQPANADVVASDVAMKVVTGIRNYDRSKGRFRPYLRTIARNALIDYYRINRRVQSTEDDKLKGMIDMESLREFRNVLRERNEQVFWEQILARMRRLVSSVQFEAWYLSAQGTPANEIAPQLGLRVQTVYNYKRMVNEKIEAEKRAFDEFEPSDIDKES